MSGRLPAEPPPREGRLALPTAVVLTIAVPGIGHIWMNLLRRGVIWLLGNLALLVILRAGGAADVAMYAVLGALRIAALVDLLITLRWARPPGNP